MGLQGREGSGGRSPAPDPPTSIRVVLAGRDPGYRSRLAERLRSSAHLDVVAVTDPGPEAFSAAANARCDVLLIRVDEPMDGELLGLEALGRRGGRPLVIVLGRLDRADTDRAEAAGVDAVVAPGGSRAVARLLEVLVSQQAGAAVETDADPATRGGDASGLTRRSVLRRALLGTAGVAALTTLRAAPAAADQRVPPRTDLALPPDQDSILVRMQRDLQRALRKPVEERRWAMVIDLRKCIGCSACTVACVAENHLPPGVVYRPVSEQEVGTYPNVARQFLPRPCMQCDDPPCTDVCPVGATYKRPDGVVEINYDKCIGCRYCIPACPYGARTFDWGENWTDRTPAYEPYEASPPPEYGQRWPTRSSGSGASPIGNVRKCQFCLHRLNAGMLPACTTTCVGAATYFGDMNDPESLVSRLIGNENVERLREDKGTEPKVYYLR